MTKRIHFCGIKSLLNCNISSRYIVLSINKNHFIKSSFYTTKSQLYNKNNNNNNNNDNSNSIEDFVSQSSKDKIQELLKLFPPIKYGFAYGSGVIKQKGYGLTSKVSTLGKSASSELPASTQALENPSATKNEPMIDLVFAVENSAKWHALNLVNNSSHYSFLKHFGPSSIATFQRKGAKIYYNTLLEHNGIKFKYGVIEYEDLIDDLKNWKSLYVSGRMQKPIYSLPQSSENGLQEISKINQESNLRNAVIAAILQLPETFSEYDLYHLICSISYKGDVRWFGGGENPNKVHNIIINNLNGFRSLYFPVIEKYLSDYLQIYSSQTSLTRNLYDLNPLLKTINYNTEQLIQFKSNITPPNQVNLIMMLPKFASSSLLKVVRRNMIDKKNDQLVNATEMLNLSLQTVVRRSSLSQTLRGIITAGVFKSLNYVKLKLLSSKKK